MNWELWTMFWLFGMLVGFGICMIVTTLKNNRRREVREVALRKITRYQWGTGVNDAVFITHIALKGLNRNGRP